MVYGVYDRSDSRMRNLNYDYGRPVLPKFRERDVKIGAMHRTGREISEKFAAIGRSFKGLLSRTADLFISAPVRSARRFNRAQENYSRKFTELLDYLATHNEPDPKKLLNLFTSLRKHEEEMSKHVAVTKPDGSRLTQAEAKNMPPEDLQKMQAAQARKLRRELMEKQFEVTLNKLSAGERNTFYSNVNKIDWNTVETEMGKTLDRNLEYAAKFLEAMNADVPQEEIRADADKTREAMAEHLKTIRDVVKPKMTPTEKLLVNGWMATVSHYLSKPDKDTARNIAKATIDLQNRMQGNVNHMVERRLEEEVSKLEAGDARKLFNNLDDLMQWEVNGWNDVTRPATKIDGKAQRNNLAEQLGLSVDTKEDDENFRLALTYLVTLYDKLNERANTPDKS